MFKKISAFMLVLMLTFSPAASLNINAQEADDDADVAEEKQTNETEEQVNDEAAEEDTDPTESDEPAVDEESKADEPVKTDAEEPEEGENADEKAADEEEAVEENEDNGSNEEDEEEAGGEGEAEQDQADEDLDLDKIYGAANGDITYDFNKGYYVLDLQAGLSNMSRSQVLQDKWVAFALPDGISLANADIPSGVVPVYIKGKNGLAVKIPDVGEFPDSKYVYPKIPLIGEMDDNDPVENLYLLNVDVAAQKFENLGQIKSQRKIDFSVMEENPTIDLHGSITGNTTYDEEEKYHFLDVSVQALNQANDSVNDLYVAFELPEGVEVVQDENTPANMEMLNLDGARAVALKLPNLKQGKEDELTYRIPVVGVSDALVTSETISVFKILDAGYQQVGEFDGHINVDFSDMDIAWHFDAIAQIIPDYPGIGDNQFGFNFAYEVKNIDVADVEKVKMEFNVPSAITIEKPEYMGGNNVDVDWDGNTATVEFGDLRGASGYEGYFTAVGSTNRSLEQLTGMEVTVTLYRDGDTVVETLNVPFEVGKYDDIGLPPGNEDDDDDQGDDTGKGGDDTGKGGDDAGKGDDTGKGGDDTGKGGDDTGKGGDDADEGGDAGKDGADNDDSGDDVTVTVEDGDDGSATTSDKTDGDGLTLPSTATNMYTILFVGALVLISGVSIMVFRKRAMN